MSMAAKIDQTVTRAKGNVEKEDKLMILFTHILFLIFCFCIAEHKQGGMAMLSRRRVSHGYTFDHESLCEILTISAP